MKKKKRFYLRLLTVDNGFGLDIWMVIDKSLRRTEGRAADDKVNASSKADTEEPH